MRLRPSRLDLDVTAGDDVRVVVTVTENGSPYSWTGASMVTAIVSMGGTVLSGVNFAQVLDAGGVFTLTLTDAQTEALGPGRWRWYVTVTKNGDTRTWIAGLLELSPRTMSGSGTPSVEESLTLESPTYTLTLDAAATPSAAALLAALLTADGAGSGLDADLLDGLHAAGFDAVISHGAVAATARTSSGPTLWIGSVDPTNAVDGDQLFRTDTTAFSVRAGGVWVEAGSSRYLSVVDDDEAAGTITFRDGIRIRTNDSTSADPGWIAKTAGSGLASPFEMRHDDIEGYIFHLNCMSGMSLGGGGSVPALIGMGVGHGGTGLYLHCYGTAQGGGNGGIGLQVAMMQDIASTSAYGMFLSQGSGASVGAMFVQSPATVRSQPVMVWWAQIAIDSSQKLCEWRKPNTLSAGTSVGYVRATDGVLVWQADVIVSGGALTVSGQVTGGAVFSSGASAFIGLYDTAGATPDSRRFRWALSGTSLLLMARNDDGTSKADLMTVSQGGAVTASVFQATAASAYFDLYDTGGTVDSRRFRIARSSTSLLFMARNDDGTSKADLFSVSQGGLLSAPVIQAAGAAAYLEFYDTGGTTNQRKFRLSQSSGSFLLTAKNDAGATVKTLLQIDQNGVQTHVDGANYVFGTSTGTKLGTATTQKIGFWNATPAVQPTAVADATDAASVITQLNALLSRLRTIGLIAP